MKYLINTFYQNPNEHMLNLKTVNYAVHNVFKRRSFYSKILQKIYLKRHFS